MVNCPKCGLRNPPSASACGKCSTPLSLPGGGDRLSLDELAAKSRVIQTRVFGGGMFVGLVIALWGMVSIDDDVTMIVFFPSVIGVFAIVSYLVSARMIRRLTNGREVTKRMTSAEIGTTLTLAFLVATKALRTHYGFALAPAIVGLVLLGIWYNNRKAVV